MDLIIARRPNLEKINHVRTNYIQLSFYKLSKILYEFLHWRGDFWSVSKANMPVQQKHEIFVRRHGCRPGKKLQSLGT